MKIFCALFAALTLLAGNRLAVAGTTEPNISNVLTQCSNNTPVIGTGAGLPAGCAGGALRLQLTANTTYYVNGSSSATANCNGQTCQPGSDSNNGLTISTPFLTLQHAINVVENNYDPAGFTPLIQLSDAAGASAAAANYTGVCQGVSALGTTVGVTIQGNTTSHTNVHMTAANSGFALSINDYCTVFLIDVQIDDAGSASDAVQSIEFAIVDIQGVTFGSFNSGATVVVAKDGGFVNFNGAASTIAGGAGQFMQADQGAAIQVKTAIAIPSAEAFTTFAVATHGSRLWGLSSSSFTGSGVAGTTGVRASISTNSIVSSSASCNSTFPGNSPCLMTSFSSDDNGDALTTPISVGSGGTGAATLTGIVVGSGTSALTATQVTGAVKDNGSGTLTQAACADLSNGAASCSTDTTNAGNISSGTLAVARGGTGVGTGALRIVGPATNVNFGSAGDNNLSLPLPSGFTRACTLQFIISGASGSITGATFQVWTAAGGTGTAVTASQSPTVSTASDNSANNAELFNSTNVNTGSYLPTSNNLFFRVGTTAAQTANVQATYIPCP